MEDYPDFFIDLLVIGGMLWGILIGVFPIVPAIVGLVMLVYGVSKDNRRGVNWGSGLLFASVISMIFRWSII